MEPRQTPATGQGGSRYDWSRQAKKETAMQEDPDHTRRWLINVSGAALLSNVLPAAPALAQGAAAGKPSAAKDEEGPVKEEPLSPVTVALATYISGALDRELPPPVLAKTKMHTLDTIAAMVSGSRLKA